MALDPETLRVLLQLREFSDGDFPPGRRGLGWSVRQGEVSEAELVRVLDGSISADANDNFHREAWSHAGATPWPET